MYILYNLGFKLVQGNLFENFIFKNYKEKMQPPLAKKQQNYGSFMINLMQFHQKFVAMCFQVLEPFMNETPA